MNRRSGASQSQLACASCKVQRRKCGNHCEFPNCFPISRLEEYKSAQQLFGSSNINKMMNTISVHRRNEAANSILLEAAIWKENPEKGCLGTILSLHQQIEYCKIQIQLANKQLAEFHKMEGVNKDPADGKFDEGKQDKQYQQEATDANSYDLRANKMDHLGNISDMTVGI